MLIKLSTINQTNWLQIARQFQADRRRRRSRRYWVKSICLNNDIKNKGTQQQNQFYTDQNHSKAYWPMEKHTIVSHTHTVWKACNFNVPLKRVGQRDCSKGDKTTTIICVYGYSLKITRNANDSLWINNITWKASEEHNFLCFVYFFFRHFS